MTGLNFIYALSLVNAIIVNALGTDITLNGLATYFG
jgi:hypothetical protein